MLTLPPLLIAALAAAATGADPAAEAVARLVAPRSAERDAAEKAIEALGDAAVPALTEATESSDLELRNRAAALLDAIEGARLARPTRVRLDFRDRPVSEVIAAIGREAGVNLAEADDARPGRNRVVTLRADEPVPLWEALDRLGRAAGLRLDPNSLAWMRQRQQMMFLNAGGRRRRPPPPAEWILRPDDGSPAAPSSDSGAIRVSVASLVLHRNRTFVRHPEAPGVTPASSAQFGVTFQVRAEPRLTIASVEGPTVAEARDDRGRSLLPAPAPPDPQQRARNGVEDPARPPSMSVALRLPDDPGRSISVLRGAFRVLVVGRRREPIKVPLAGSAGKSFAAGSAALTVQAVRVGPDGRDMTVELAIDRAAAGGPPMVNPTDPRAGLRPPPSALGQVEFYDAKGQLCGATDLAALGMAYGPMAPLRIPVQSPEGIGPPTEMRYFGATWATVEVPFQFRDVPMP